MLRHVSSRRGSTLLEVVVGAALIAFALVAALESVESVGQMNELHRQERRALEVAETKLAYLRSQPFANVVTVAATLATFSVPDLPPRRQTGSQGQLTVYTDETAVPAALGGPMDLNGNGNATDVNVSADYKILPVKVTIAWGTRSGPDSSVTLWTILNGGDGP